MQQAQREGWHGPQAAWATAPRGVSAVSQQRPQLSVIANPALRSSWQTGLFLPRVFLAIALV